MTPDDTDETRVFILQGRVGRHARFNDRLMKVLFGCWVVLIAAAVFVNHKLSRGPVPWWRDVLFFVGAPVVTAALLFGVFLGVSRLHARAINLRCSACGKTLTQTQATAICLTNRCPLCSTSLNVDDYIS